MSHRLTQEHGTLGCEPKYGGYGLVHRSLSTTRGLAPRCFLSVRGSILCGGGGQGPSCTRGEEEVPLDGEVLDGGASPKGPTPDASPRSPLRGCAEQHPAVAERQRQPPDRVGLRTGSAQRRALRRAPGDAMGRAGRGMDDLDDPAPSAPRTFGSTASRLRGRCGPS